MSTTVNITEQPSSGERYRRDFQRSVSEQHKVPAPIYRHAAPAAPWPWMNFDIDASEVRPLPPGGLTDISEWGRYPQSLFGNWTRDQVDRSQMLTKCNGIERSRVYKVDVRHDGGFEPSGEERIIRNSDVAGVKAFWNQLGAPPPSNLRVRALFVEDMSLPVLQILGTRYNVEPFFFASSANWIPSRYQEDPKAHGDHITVILPFIRTMKKQRPIERSRPVTTTSFNFDEALSQVLTEESLPYTEEKQIIDTQAPLPLPGNQILLQDLLAIHMVRTTTTSTIISYHPSGELQRTSAKRLQLLVQRTGDSVYWSKIFHRSKDPTFLFLAILWYALYAWDEAFEVLYRYINALESNVLRENDIKLTRELHKLQAHLLYYQQLLRDFQMSVEFVRDTPNPAMNAPSITEEERKDSSKLLHKEANNLISEIKRLSEQREMQFDRLQNVIRLAFATVSIQDSKAMQGLAMTTMQDSAAMKQIAYLTMIFIPATYLANVFSMNVREINPPTTASLAHYVAAALGLTLFTSWLMIALQEESVFHAPQSSVWRRTIWPVYFVWRVVSSEVKSWFGTSPHTPNNSG